MLKTWRTILIKEARDLWRDRRALFFLFAIPLLMPIAGALAAAFLLWQVAVQTGEGLPIAVLNRDQMPGLVARLEEETLLQVIDAPDNPKEALQSGELMAVLEIPANAARRLKAEEPVTLTLTSSRSGWLPDFAIGAIRSALDDYNEEIVIERLAQRALEPGWLEPIRLEWGSAAPVGISATPIAMGKAVPASWNSVFMPLIVVSWTFSGGLSLMASMTVGEKENHTMEPLLVTPANRIGVVLGKITLSIIVSAFIIGLWSLDSLGYLLSFSLMTVSLNTFLSSLTEQLASFLLVIVWLVLLMLPSMTMANGIVGAGCTFAKNYREANLFLSALQLLLPGVAFLALFGIGAKPPLVVYGLPLVGVLVAMRDLFGGGIGPWPLALALVSAIVYAAGAVLLAAHVFSREWALMRGV